MMYFKTIVIAVVALNFFEINCQCLKQGNILECYTSDGWHDAEFNNKRSCNGEKCFGLFGFNFPGIMFLVEFYIFNNLKKSFFPPMHLPML